MADHFHPDSSISKPVRVAWFPGPDGPTWASSGDKGFREAIKNSHIKIIDSAWGDTGKSVQGKLVKASLDKHSNLDYIIGTTVSADAAVELLRRRKLNKKIKVLAYYYGPGVDRGIRRGNVIAAPTDFQAIQARIAMDLAVRALEGRDYLKHVGPRIILIDRSNIKSVNPLLSLPPRGFRPIFSENDWGN